MARREPGRPDQAGPPLAGADQLLSTSVDGYTSGTPLQVVLDGRNALLAVAMNGTALPVEHGFPARMVVPGLYGYVSATKWVTDIEVTTFAAAFAYWVQRGWSQQAPIKTESRIDVPVGGASLRPGRTPVAGVAWAQHKGIAAVEVRVDRGPWHQARLAAVPGIDTWRQWVWEWPATPGNHLLEARATDADRLHPDPGPGPAAAQRRLRLPLRGRHRQQLLKAALVRPHMIVDCYIPSVPVEGDAAAGNRSAEFTGWRILRAADRPVRSE